MAGGCAGARVEAADPRKEGVMTRRCEIASRLGFTLFCPPGGCRLARELGELVAEDCAEPCVVERLAGERAEPIVLWTLEYLRGELEAARPAAPHAPPREPDRGRRHREALSRWSATL
jgi:hypothetical protein